MIDSLTAAYCVLVLTGQRTTTGPWTWGWGPVHYCTEERLTWLTSVPQIQKDRCNTQMD